MSHYSLALSRLFALNKTCDANHGNLPFIIGNASSRAAARARSASPISTGNRGCIQACAIQHGLGHNSDIVAVEKDS